MLDGGHEQFRSSFSNALDNLTMELWVNPHLVLGANQGLLSNSGAGGGYDLMIQTNFTVQGIVQGVAFLNASSGTLRQFHWNHVIMVRAATQWRYWINGKRDPQDAGADTPSAPGGMSFGAFGNTFGSNDFKRGVASIAFYDRLLQPNEILENYQLGIQEQFSILPFAVEISEGGALSQKSGAAISTFTGSSLDETTYAETGVGIDPRTASGLDETTYAEAGTGIDPHTASGLDEATHTESGTTIAPFSGGGVRGGIEYIKAGSGITAFVASGISRRERITTGLAISARVASGESELTFTESEVNSFVVFNTGRGRIGGLVDRVNTNDPANSAIVLVVLKRSGLSEDETMKDFNTLADILAGTNNEVTNSGYSRKILDNTSSVTAIVNDSTNSVLYDFPDQSWTTVGAAGGAWGALLVCYDSDTTSGTDSTIIPLTKHNFEITPDGRTIFAMLDFGGFAKS
jgi:hypothetical protein